MEIASSSRSLHLFPTEQRFKIKRVGCKSDITSRTKEEERYDLLRKKRNLCEEERKPNKRQKKTSITEPVDPKVVAKPALRFGEPNSRVTKSVTISRIRIRPNVVSTKPIDEEEIVNNNQSCSLRDLIAKAKEKVEEKREIDGRREYIARLRLEARLAINQVVRTVVVHEDHLKYHSELEQLGCGFIHDQVTCLTKFSLLSRSDYFDDSVSTQLLWSDGDSEREKQESSLQESTNQR